MICAEYNCGMIVDKLRCRLLCFNGIMTYSVVLTFEKEQLSFSPSFPVSPSLARILPALPAPETPAAVIALDSLDSDEFSVSADAASSQISSFLPSLLHFIFAFGQVSRVPRSICALRRLPHDGGRLAHPGLQGRGRRRGL